MCAYNTLVSIMCVTLYCWSLHCTTHSEQSVSTCMATIMLYTSYINVQYTMSWSCCLWRRTQAVSTSWIIVATLKVINIKLVTYTVIIYTSPLLPSQPSRHSMASIVTRGNRTKRSLSIYKLDEVEYYIPPTAVCSCQHSFQGRSQKFVWGGGL